jgi:protein-S-isoprenylcysteine O-methyltransferase Ste14
MTSPDRMRRLGLLLDGVERILICVLFGWLAFRFAASLRETPGNIVFLFSEGLVASFVLLRRPTDAVSLRPLDWLMGAAGTALPMLMAPVGGGWSGAIGLCLFGFAISVGAKLSLRRSFGVVAANRGVKSDGLYGAVRHPMYLGYFLLNGGMLALNPSAWNAALLVVWAGLQLARIAAEERILLQDEAYRRHAEKVRFRLLPLVY